METSRPPSTLKTLAAITVIILFGFAVRLLLVQVNPGIYVPPQCEVVSDFWNGDHILC